MLTLITRKGQIITASADGGSITRTHECRNVQSAVVLECKLISDPGFAGMWVLDGDTKPPKRKPHGLERRARDWG